MIAGPRIERDTRKDTLRQVQRSFLRRTIHWPDRQQSPRETICSCGARYPGTAPSGNFHVSMKGNTVTCLGSAVNI